MKQIVFAGLLAVGLATGCNKGEQASAPAPSAAPDVGAAANGENPTAAQPATPEQPQGGPPQWTEPAKATEIAAPTGGNMQGVLDQLTQAYRRYVFYAKRRPTSFQDFVTSAKIQVPPAPAGKEYRITADGRVVLADQ
jgi:hypothetical protein